MAEQIPITLRVGLDVEEATRTLVRFLKDYTTDARIGRFVIGLSGGLDSAVSAALGVRAVGASNVTAVILPDKNTSKRDLEDAATVARWLGIPTVTHTIQPFLEAHEFTRGLERGPQGNVKARLRMILLHAEAAKRNALVLGTGNKSEILTGYFTKFGDGGVDVQPIGDLYKTQVRLLAKHLGVPSPVISKPPSAGLWEGQTDEAELGVTYEQLDRALLGLELKLPLEQIAQIVSLSKAQVDRIETLRRTTQHKRRMPMIPKIGLRTPGIDWRALTLET